MKNDQKISKEVWKLYREFDASEKTDKDWDGFINQGRKLADQYQGPDKDLAEDMFLAFVSYLEAQREQQRRTA